MFDPSALSHFPTKSGVYIMKGETGNILYIGKAKNLRTRVKQYFALKHDKRAMIPILVPQIADIETIVTFSEKEALLLENTLIKKHQPKYNVFLRDDKTYISLMINHKHEWPRVQLVRYKGKPDPNHLVFGPYTNALAARQTFDLLCKIFPLRECSDHELKSRKRPCLLYSIKRCIAPCVHKCNRSEYDHYVKHTIDFLKGNNVKVLDQLKEEMKKASDALEYEKAGAILRSIKQIEEIMKSPKTAVYSNTNDCDVFGYHRMNNYLLIIKLIYRDGKLSGSEQYDFSQILDDDEELFDSFLVQHYKEGMDIPPEILLPIPLTRRQMIEEILEQQCKKMPKLTLPKRGSKDQLIKLANQNATILYEQQQQTRFDAEDNLLSLQETLHLSRLPSRIECFDTSNISGTNPVASMVVFSDGQIDRKRGRLYKIKEHANADDYTAMREVLFRRYQRAKDEEDLPDLIVVDGGKGQLGLAVEVIKQLEIASVDVIALAKEEGRHDKGMTKERIFLRNKKEPIELDARSSILLFLQKIRDETHAKAISYHRKTRSSRIFKSALDQVPGIGPIKKKRLMNFFGSVKQIQNASDDDLLSVHGINQTDVESIRRFL